MTSETLRLLNAATGFNRPYRIFVTDSESGATWDCLVERPFALIGRAETCDVTLDDVNVSHKHAYLQVIEGRIFCVDLSSRTGIRWADGPQTAGWLQPDEPILISRYSLRLEESDAAGVELSEKSSPFVEFNPLEFYQDEFGPLPGVEVEFLNQTLEQSVWQARRILTIVGRGGVCKVRLADESVSRVHCSLLLTRDGLWAIDLGGRGGIRANEEACEFAQLADTDIFEIGRFRMQVRAIQVREVLTASQLVDDLDRHRIVSRQQIEAILATKPVLNADAGLEGESKTDTQRLLDLLVAQRLLTAWQAEQIAANRIGELVLDGRYKLIGVIGVGGMGIVYHGLDLRLGREVAVKVPNRLSATKARSLKRFRREALISARMEHRNIVRTLDVGIDDLFMVQEYIDGDTVEEFIAQHGPQPPHIAVDYVMQLVEALDFAFRDGVIHRDIKPANVLITADGTVKLLDLGLARLKDGADSPHETAESLREQLTRVGIKLGTVGYMAPEQASDGHVADTRSDIYGVGCTFYELLAGRPPFPGDNAVRVMMAHASEPVPEIPGLDPRLTEILNKSLAKKPDDRFQLPAEFLSALRHWQSETQPAEKIRHRVDAVASSTGTGVSGIDASGRSAVAQMTDRSSDASEDASGSGVSTQGLTRSGSNDTREDQVNPHFEAEVLQRERLNLVVEREQLANETKKLRAEKEQVTLAMRDFQRKAATTRDRLRKQQAELEQERTRLNLEREKLSADRKRLRQEIDRRLRRVEPGSQPESD